MKKFFDKKVIVCLFICILTITFVKVNASTSYNSDAVLYKNGDTDVTVTEALNNLYNNLQLIVDEEKQWTLMFTLSGSANGSWYHDEYRYGTYSGSTSSQVMISYNDGELQIDKPTINYGMSGGNGGTGKISISNLSIKAEKYTMNWDLTFTLSTSTSGSWHHDEYRYGSYSGSTSSQVTISYNNGELQINKPTISYSISGGRGGSGNAGISNMILTKIIASK